MAPARQWARSLSLGFSLWALAAAVAGNGNDQCVDEDCEDVELLHLRQSDAEGRLQAEEAWSKKKWKRDPNRVNFKVFAWNSATPRVRSQWRKGHVALAMRGGGARSMAGVTGQLRALQSLGLLDEVDQIISISGTGWAMAPYLFAKGLTSEALLGSVVSTDLSILTPQWLAAGPNGAIAGTNALPIQFAANGMPASTPNEDFYNQLIGATYLCAFNLNAALPPGLCSQNNNSNQIWAENAWQLKGIKARNRKLDISDALTIQRTNIKSFVAGAVLIAPVGYQPNSSNMVATRMSPDFSGSPFYADCRTSDFSPIETTPFENLTELTDVVVGGGVVEAFAFLATNTPKRDKGQAGKTLLAFSTFAEDNTDNAAVLTLQDAVGISSSVLSLSGWASEGQAQLAGILTLFGRDPSVIFQDPLAYTARKPYWPIGSEKKGDTSLKDFYLGDSGNLENHGILEAIRSGATCIISLLNSNQPVDDSFIDCQTFQINQTRLQEIIETSPPLFDLFGLAVSIPNFDFLAFAGFDYSNNAVFDTTALFPIICDAALKRTAGVPTTVSSTLTTLENKFWGIEAGKTVHIVWVFTEKTAAFEALLPQETQESINNGTYDGSSDIGWPYMSTFSPAGPTPPNDLAAPTQSQVNLYAAQTEWSLLQNQAEIEACIHAADNGGIPPVVPTPR